MSIVTKTGDLGSTGLMYNRRVSKAHPRVEAFGCVDELNAALGLARASSADAFLGAHLLAIQRHLVTLMGELATEPADFSHYLEDGFAPLTAEVTAELDRLAVALDKETATPRGWALPGETVSSAALDLARTICRRAERRVCALQELGGLQNPEAIVFLNRLADVLWLLARRSSQATSPTDRASGREHPGGPGI